MELVNFVNQVVPVNLVKQVKLMSLVEALVSIYLEEAPVNLAKLEKAGCAVKRFTLS